jgi:hypothetical protein
MRLVAHRSITISGFTAEANPNVTVPAANKIYTVKDRNPQTDQYLLGFGLSAVFSKASPGATFDDDVATASISFVLWMKDSTGSDWVKMSADTAIHRILKTTADLRCSADIFMQVTAINNVASADTVNLRVTEI